MPAADLASRLGRLPRVRLGAGPTPLQRLDRLEAAIGPSLAGTRLFVKRDDLAGVGGGGSKLRKLEFLVGEAARRGADTLVAAGPYQSNSVRLTAAAAACAGMRCELVLHPLGADDGPGYRRNGNALLDVLFGATLHDAPDGAAARDIAAQRADALAAGGRTAFVVPGGATSALATLGHVDEALEIEAQERAQGLRFDEVVVPNGSSGLQAGLVAGFVASGRGASLVEGHSVYAAADEAHRATLALARDALALLDLPTPIDPGTLRVSDAQRGERYGRPTAPAIEAVRTLAAHEGLLLDPVYGGKAFAGLLARARAGELGKGRQVLFVLTGGTPALFAFAEAFAPTRAHPPARGPMP